MFLVKHVFFLMIYRLSGWLTLDRRSPALVKLSTKSSRLCRVTGKLSEKCDSSCNRSQSQHFETFLFIFINGHLTSRRGYYRVSVRSHLIL